MEVVTVFSVVVVLVKLIRALVVCVSWSVVGIATIAVLVTDCVIGT